MVIGSMKLDLWILVMLVSIINKRILLLIRDQMDFITIHIHVKRVNPIKDI
jgi:hypothetical protein